MNLLSRHISILRTLDDRGGDTANQIGFRVFGETHSAQSRSRTTNDLLKQMRSAGLVELIDDQRPLAWRRTEAGRAALAAARAGEQS